MTFGKIVAKSGTTLLARVPGLTTPLLQRADIAAITLDVWDESTDTSTHSGALDKNATISDTPLTAGWTEGGTYNATITLPASAFPLGGRIYRVEVGFTLTQGEPFYLPPWRLQAETIKGDA